MGAATANDRRLLGVSEIVARTGLDEATIRGHLNRGEWPGVQVGKRKVWRVPVAVVEALLAGRDPAELKVVR